MLILHIANKNYSSWSLRAWLVLKTLDIVFEEQIHYFRSMDNSQEFTNFSPSTKVPCLHDAGIIVWDSLAIIEYLYEKYPAVWPANSTARAWARSACAEMHSGFTSLRNALPMSCGVRVKLGPITTNLQTEITRIKQLWQEGLMRFNGPFLAGANFTAVDAFFAPVVFRFQTYSIELSEDLQQYYHRILALPATQQWYTAALRENYSEAQHELDTSKAGTISADLRQLKQIKLV